jgi:hypothetical protein
MIAVIAELIPRQQTMAPAMAPVVKKCQALWSRRQLIGAINLCLRLGLGLNLARFSEWQRADNGEPVDFSFGTPAMKAVSSSSNTFHGLMAFDDFRRLQTFQVASSFEDTI